MDELYLDNIDEYVNDQDKIVTYKWLSLALGVHVNTAKQMLYHYLDHKRKESSAQLHATYLVSGKFVDNGHASHKVSVVREEQLEDFKSKMSLIVSEHVYSVQKALLRDSGPLYTVDYDAVKDNLSSCGKHSAIRCSDAVPVSSVEGKTRQAPSTPVPEPQQGKKPTANSDVASSKAKPAKGIMGMFAVKAAAAESQNGGKEVKSEPREAAAEVNVFKGKALTKSNHTLNFFGNQGTKKPVKKEEEETVESSSAELQQLKKEPEQKVTTEPPKHNKKDSRSKTKRLQSSDSEEEKMETKKRRRIKKPVPDSSEDEDVIPDSPPRTAVREVAPLDVPAKEPASHPGLCETTKIRKRRRVLKSRTFVDEEGCIVTEKGYESESYSEDDSAVQQAETKIQAKAKTSMSKEKKSQKKSTENKATKQASIMGFFQKK